VLSLLTLNVRAAGLPRARALLRWLDRRPEDVFILTETSAGEGTNHLLDQCRRAGLAVIHTPDPAGDRGVALLGRVPLVARPELVAGVSVPCRVAATTIAGQPEFAVVGIYVAASGRAPDKVTRKKDFVTRSWPP
jgi:exodeoxyribonuclease III